MPDAGPLKPPAIYFRQRLWSAPEVEAMASGVWETLGEPFRTSRGLTAMVMGNQVEAVALFFALSACRAPLLLLGPDPRGWATSPPIPRGTRLVLTPAFAHLDAYARSLGLDVRHLPPAEPGPTEHTVPFLTCPGFVFLTSGSTGAPRPVYRSAGSLIAASRTLGSALLFPAPDSGIVATLPLDRSYGLNNGVMLATVLGRTLGLLERFDHNEMIALCENGTYWYWAGTPVMADILSRSQRPGQHRMPQVCAFAGRLTSSVSQTFAARFGVPLRQLYGTTETLTITLNRFSGDEHRFESAGLPLPGVEVRIGNAPGTPVSAGEIGRVWIRTPWLMEGYGFPPDVACDALIDGWWPSPDAGHLDEVGRLTLVGRLDDRIRSAAGHVLDPREVIAALEAYPGVVDTAVVPVITTTGTVFGALVEAAQPLRPLDLRNHLARTIPSWSMPRTVKVVSQLPRLASGRVDRRACVALFEDSQSPRNSS